MSAPPGGLPGQSLAETQTLRGLGVLHQLCMEAVLAKTPQELHFKILNRSAALCGYDRAALCDLRQSRPKLLGVSGVSEPGQYSELTATLCELVFGLAKPEEPQILPEDAFSGTLGKTFAEYGGKFTCFRVLWLPIKLGDIPKYGLWIERWNGPWNESEAKLLASLCLAYGAGFEKFEPRLAWRDLWPKLWTKKRLLAGVLGILLLLFLVRLPLRVVAPCEVAPLDPFVVTAPLNGVISEVLVQPSQEVRKDAPLFSYDKRVLEEELNIARQQVRIIESSLNRSNLQAFLDPKAKAELSLLELRLEQEKIRLQLAQYNASKAVVPAEIAGRVVIDDPSEWRGKPVSIGEKVLSIVEPQRTKLKIWLALDDYADFDFAKPLSVLLNAFPETPLAARLDYVSLSASPSSQGVPSFLAEARFSETGPSPRVGLQGTAVLRGQKVSLFYWLARKPLAWLRRTSGF